MSRRAARKAAYFSGGTVEGLMLPAPPWMISRGAMRGWGRGGVLYSIAGRKMRIGRLA